MTWAERAAVAERSVVGRHLGRVWVWPTGRLARTASPPAPSNRWHEPLHYWWQAHVLDCLVDAELRAPSAARRQVIRAWPRAQWARNGFRWTNHYFDDIAWFGLALERVGRLGLGNPRGLEAVVTKLERGWVDDHLGGIRWRAGDDFRNAPTNGPAAVLFARVGRRDLAERSLDWMRSRLLREDGLLADGIRPSGRVEARYTYCQGLYLGALVELGHDDEARAVAAAIRREVCTEGVLHGQGGGDGGLFAGITARYLALAGADDVVLACAEAAWENRTATHEGVYFGPDWAVAAQVPTADDPLGANQQPNGVTGAAVPERDLSVQLSGWMLMEAAAALALRGGASRPPQGPGKGGARRSSSGTEIYGG